MEPATITALAVATVKLLSPYLKEFASSMFKKTGEEVGKSAVDGARVKAGHLFELIKQKMHPSAEGTQALANIERNPEDTAAQVEVQTQLEQQFHADEGFAQQIEALLKQIAATKADVSFVNNIQGDVEKLVNIGTVMGNVSI